MRKMINNATNVILFYKNNAVPIMQRCKIYEKAKETCAKALLSKLQEGHPSDSHWLATLAFIANSTCQQISLHRIGFASGIDSQIWAKGVLRVAI